MNTTVSIPTLADAAALCYVRVSIWSARKLDKKQTQKSLTSAGATNDGGRFNKHLLANADAALKEVQRKGNQIRDYVDANTLPWDDAGNRLISNVQMLTTVGDLARLQGEFNDAVDAFVAEYPVLRAQAIANLGTMGDDSDYPQPDVVRSKVSVKVSYSPLPTGFGDIRQGMTQQQAAAWQSHFEGNVKAQVNGALSNAWGRLRESLERYSDRLQPRSGDDADKMRIFKDTMVEGLRDTLTLLNGLNVFGDANLSQICAEVSSRVASIDAGALRSSPATAVSVKMDVDEILRRMKAFQN